MIYTTVAEYDAEIAVVSAAITRALKLGATTGTAVAGNSRDNTEVDFDKLFAYRKQLQMEKGLLQGKTINIRAAW